MAETMISQNAAGYKPAAFFVLFRHSAGIFSQTICHVPINGHLLNHSQQE